MSGDTRKRSIVRTMKEMLQEIKSANFFPIGVLFFITGGIVFFITKAVLFMIHEFGIKIDITSIAMGIMFCAMLMAVGFVTWIVILYFSNNQAFDSKNDTTNTGKDYY